MLDGGRFAQVAWESAAAEANRISAGSDPAVESTSKAPLVRLLGDEIGIAELGEVTAPHFVIGLDEDHHDAVVDLGRHGSWVVLGPSLSGRTTALATAMGSVDTWGLGVDRVLLCGRETRLDTTFDWTDVGLGETAALGLVDELIGQVQQDRRPRLVVIDDLDELLDGPCAMALDRLWRSGRDARCRWIVSMASYRAATSFEPIVRALLAGRHGLLLQPDTAADGDLLGVRLPRRAGLRFPAGRGYLIGDGSPKLVQVARSTAAPTVGWGVAG